MNNSSSHSSPHSSPHRASHDALRRLTAPHALAFGCRLLDRGPEGSITFREFVSVAQELIALRPEQSAIYLAGLVALDMSNEDCIIATRHEEPSSN